MSQEETRRAFQREIQKAEGKIPRNPTVDAESVPAFFHDGQRRMMDCEERLILVLCGKQAGKTFSGVYWMRREMQRTAELDPGPDGVPNHYLIAGPTLAILDNKAIPEFLRLFPDDGEFGKYDKAKHKYHLLPAGSIALFGFVTECTVHFGYAANPESLAAMTIKAAWLDEAGQTEFKRDSYEEILSRLTIFGGRMLITTTAYVSTGWLRELYESLKGSRSLISYKTSDLGMLLWKKGQRGSMRTVRAARKRLPAWKFKMWYEGAFTRPPGAVYDCFDGDVGKRGLHTEDRFPIPDDWRLYWGMDFGPVHTCIMMFAENPKPETVTIDGKDVTVKGRLHCYDSYLPDETGDGRRTFDEHAGAVRLKSMGRMSSRKYREPAMVFGGAKSEDAQRVQYRRRGINVCPPRFENDVVSQIELTYAALKNGQVVFFNDLKGPISEILDYSYKVDEDHNVDETKIERKEKMHRMDALRYVVASVFPGQKSDPKTVSRFKGEGEKRPLPFRM